jgi:hypothetical protein
MDRGRKYNHGFSENEWRLAKEQARAAMIRRAKRGATMTYTDLCEEVSAISFSPHDPRLAHFLGEISTEEDAAGRGMLTAVVVHKHDRWPGAGFFELAQSLGRRVSDPEKVWIAELDKLRAAHADRA